MRMVQLSIILAAASAAMAILFASGCRVGYSFRGPGYNPEQGVIHPEAGRQVFVMVTQADVEQGSAGKFSARLKAVMSTMNTHEGLIGYAARKELFGSRVWTISAWINRESMQKFTHSNAHRRAVVDGGIQRGSFVAASTFVDVEKMPLSWSSAQQLLEEQIKRE